MSGADLHSARVVFLGAGNMAEALVQGLTKGGLCRAERITITDIRPERLKYFGDTFGVMTSATNREAAANADLLVLAVKPQVMEEVLREITGGIPADCVVVSIAAGVPTGRIERHLGEGAKVVRAMPNTPALVGLGAAAICAGAHATAADLDLAAALLEAVGTVARVEEAMMDAVTALSGSGPAYVLYLVEGMTEGARRLGMAPELALRLAARTVEGAAGLMLQTRTPPDVLRERVTSKGGTTAAAIGVLEARLVKEAVADAVVAAARRSKELSNS